mmetsp:Transcript_23064/g.73189  ORF Transcript_23064/g.73189 Transcript_23064/m.73189 type:complete len:179 (+) Transcript_23064:14-550(+)
MRASRPAWPAATLACIVAAAVLLHRARRRRVSRLTFYDRGSSNNAARIRLWMYLEGAESAITVVPVTHAEQRSEEYRSVNPFMKCPALTIHFSDGSSSWLAEAAIILEYLSDTHRRPWSRCYLPHDPELRAHVRLVVRCHDLYLASPNCSQPGPFTHTQGCMRVPPPGGINRSINIRW